MNTPAAPAPDPGRTRVSDRVVTKIAAQAVAEVPAAEPATSRLPGSDRPKVDARVDGGLVSVHVRMAVRWPRPVPEVAREVRDRVRRRVGEFTGLPVGEVDIDVTALPGQGDDRQRRVS